METTTHIIKNNRILLIPRRINISEILSFSNKLSSVLLILFYSITNYLNSQNSETKTSTGNGTWICPSGVTSIAIECWGAGGGGGGGGSGAGCGTAGYGSGGAGGSYTIKVISVLPGSSYKYTIGAGGSGGTSGGIGSTGGSTYFGNSVAGNSSDASILAIGGIGGNGNLAGSGIALGNSSGNIGTTSYNGGDGSSFSGTNSGAGGAGGGSESNGGSAMGTSAGTSTSYGGTGGNGRTNNGVGYSGTQPGGGGGGGRNSAATCRAGGAGGAGMIKITYSTPTNYLCSTATSLPCSTSNLEGTTFSTTGTAHGTGYLVSNFGVWYTFTGDGNSTTITSVGTGGFDQEMILLSGSCESLTAIADIDASSSNGTESYSFTTTNSLTYYIYIAYWSSSGTINETGSFTISRTCTTPLNISWTGGTSIQWGTASNWSTNSVPTSNDHVTIPSGTNYSPTISSTTLASCKNLTINSGATLTYAPNCSGSCSYYLDIYGNLINNGTITQTGTSPIFFNTSSTTISGTGDMSTAWLSIFACNVTLASDISVNKFTIYNSSSTFNLSSYSLAITTYLDQNGTLELNTGTIEYKGTNANLSFNDSYLNEGTGTFFYNGVTNSQTIKTGTYYNLKIGTISGNTATIGNSAAVTVSNDLTIINPSTAGGIATLAYDVTVAGNFNLGNSGNALTLNMPYRIYRSSGTGTFTMGNISNHAINISYTDASNFAIAGFGSPTFYGTVTYTSASAQKVITATSYNNLTIDLAGTKTLFGNLDVNGNLTLTAGTLDVSSSNYSINLAGDFVRAASSTFSPQSGTVTFDGTSNQVVHVTSSGGTTACDSDVTFYNVIIDGTSVKMYYNKTNNRIININDLTVNSGKTLEFVSQ